MMQWLELKLPPVLVTVLFAALMWLVARSTPGFPAPGTVRQLVAGVLCLAAAWIGFAGLRAFHAAGTTVNPLDPGSSRELVASGVYRLSRNPMYLALLIVLLAWGFWLANLFSLAMTALFVLYIDRFQIRPEERSMEALFGRAFLDYRQRVRKWL
jgi:protein-S-isoprenylcysteine O-methyltransferase Ste14